MPRIVPCNTLKQSWEYVSSSSLDTLNRNLLNFSSLISERSRRNLGSFELEEEDVGLVEEELLDEDAKARLGLTADVVGKLNFLLRNGEKAVLGLSNLILLLIGIEEEGEDASFACDSSKSSCSANSFLSNAKWSPLARSVIFTECTYSFL